MRVDYGIVKYFRIKEIDSFFFSCKGKHKTSGISSFPNGIQKNELFT